MEGTAGLLSREEGIFALDRSLKSGSGCARLVVAIIELDCPGDSTDLKAIGGMEDFIRQTAAHLRSNLPPNAVLSRYGGNSLFLFAEWKLKARPYFLKSIRWFKQGEMKPRRTNAPLAVKAMAGAAVCRPDSEGGEQLLGMAEIALQQAKQKDGCPFALYKPVEPASVKRELLLHLSLKQALYDDQLELCCKPVYRLAEGKLAAIEATMNWNHPVIGELGMNAFMPCIARSGLSVPFGERLIRDACRRLADYRSYVDPGLKMIVKLTPKQLGYPRFIDFIIHSLQEKKLPANSLVIEFGDESSLMEQAVIVGLTRLRAAGIGLALSASEATPRLLPQLPVTSLQLPASIVSHMLDGYAEQLLAVSVIKAAHRFGMTVAAQGVAYREQLDVLRFYGCDYVQGYLFGRAGEPGTMDETALPSYTEQGKPEALLV